MKRDISWTWVWVEKQKKSCDKLIDFGFDFCLENKMERENNIVWRERKRLVVC